MATFGRGTTWNKGQGVKLWREGEERRQKFLARLLENGGNIAEACRFTGVAQGTYTSWRKRAIGFGDKADAFRSMGKGEAVKALHWTGGFIDWRRAFLKTTTPWFQAEIVGHLEKGEPGSVTLVLLPPESGKSTLLEDWITYKLSLDPQFRVTFGSRKQDHAKKVLGRVMNRMEPDGPYPELVKRFGPFVPQTGGRRKKVQPWSAAMFDVFKKSSGDQRDHNMIAIGFDASVIGTRTDLLVGDDLQDVLSLGMTEKFLERFRQDWLSRPGGYGRTVILANRVGDGDLYVAMQDAGIVDHVVRYPAILYTGEALWPERYDLQMLERVKKKVGPVAWARNYMQNPRDAGDGTFTVAIVERSKRSDLAMVDLPAGANVYVGLDPNISSGAGRNAIVAGAHLPGDRFRLLAAREDRNLARNADIFQRLEEIVTRFPKGRVTDVVVEVNAFQKGLMEDEGLLELQRRYGFSLRGHTTTANKYDSNIGIPSMATSWMRDEVEIPFKGVDEEAEFADLCEELLSWRIGVKGADLRMDLVMAAWMAWIPFNERRAPDQSESSDFNFRPLPFAPTKPPALTRTG